jgi:toxin ParE1/3/4
MRVILTPDAIEHLKGIEEYIGADSRGRAHAFLADLRTRIRQIGRTPRAHPLAERYEHLGLRRRPYRDYLIFYRIDANIVRVIAIVHGARDYDRILDPDA